MNKTILMLSASCMSIIAGADLCYADFNHFDTSPSFIPAGVKSHVSTHTSHLTAGHLSSLEDFAELTLPENSDLSLPKNSGSYLSYPLPKDLGRGWGGFHNTPPSNSLPPASLLTPVAVRAMNSAAIMPMIMTAGYLPEVMTMTSTMPNAAARKAILKPPVPKVRNLSTSAPTTALISKNVFLPVRVITSPVKSPITVSVKTVTENMLPAKKTPNAPAKRKTQITQTLVITDNN